MQTILSAWCQSAADYPDLSGLADTIEQFLKIEL